MSAGPSSTTFRDMVAAISPSWLQGFVGLRFMYSMAIQFDAIADAAAYAVRARFPDLAPPDAFPYLANDRQIEQGFQEPQTSYATRLTQWLDRWSHVGSPFGLLMAIRGFISPDLAMVATVNNRGVYDYYSQGVQDAPSVPPTHFKAPGSLYWAWDRFSWPYLFTFAYWRIWVIIWPSAGTWTQTTHKYDDGLSKWDAGFTYDWSGTVAQANALRALIKKWKRSRTWVPWIIISFDPLAFLPSGADELPNGLYGTWSKVVTGSNGRPQYVPSRLANAAYLDGVA